MYLYRLETLLAICVCEALNKGFSRMYSQGRKSRTQRYPLHLEICESELNYVCKYCESKKRVFANLGSSFCKPLQLGVIGQWEDARVDNIIYMGLDTSLGGNDI